MIVFEFKLKGKKEQYLILDEMIRTANFIRNKALRYWLDNKDTSSNDLQKLCAVLASEYEWAGKLNSQARQASADRAWFAISRFYANCKAKKTGKKGFPKFKKKGHSVEYKNTGWKLSSSKKYLNLTDKFKAGKFKLIGTRDLYCYEKSQIKRVRIVKHADGYYAQFCLNIDRKEEHNSTGLVLGIDVGLEFFYTDSEGNTVENPRYLRNSEKRLKRLQKRVSKKKKGSKNRRKARAKLARKHLKVSRQRKDFAIKTAKALVQSSDLVVYEDLKVCNLVKNRRLAKSISDVSWSLFLEWVEVFGKIYGVECRAVAPHYTSQDCSNCNTRVPKTLSNRTHQCPKCGLKLHRDHNAARKILAKGLSTEGHSETNAWEENNLYLSQAIASNKLAR
ncbi:MAG: IS200/IS605 family element transposase accessory protein TnpB [Moorea sp. SIO2B7]|nr:IS200/IS605 family element transposase accessory protein TnpB [Moorena sp. SIO2B7]